MEGYPSVPTEVSQSIKLYMFNNLKEKIQMRKKKHLINSLNEDKFYEINEVDYDEIEEVGMTNFEKQMKHAMRKVITILKKVGKIIRGVVVLHNLVVLRSTAARSVAST